MYDDEPEAPSLSPGGESGLELGSDLVEGDYKCPICSKVMANQKEFTSHLRGHNEVKPSPDPSDPTGQAKVYNCCLCGKMLSSFSSLDRHMLVHSGERPFSCEVCGQTFTTNGNMHRHQRTHGLKAPGEGDSEGKLPTCGLLQNRKRKEPGTGGSGNTTEDDMSGTGTNNNAGAKEVFSSASVGCPVCKEKFINDISVETHILTSHPGQHLKCDSCPAMYPTFQNLKLHKYLHHLSSIPSSFPSSPIPNPFTAFMASQQEKSPLKIPFHSGDTLEEDTRSLSPPAKPVKSQLEGALTRPLVKDKDLADIPSIITMAQNFPGINKGESKPSEQSAADNDMTIEEDDEAGSPKKMRLDEDPPFDDDPVIKEMKLKGEFPCSLCPAVFPNLRALKGHNKEHLGKAPYRCNVGTCTYSSNDKSTLTRHMRRHTGEKPFECKICQFGFTTKANCERHLKNKHQKLTRESIRESLIIHETEDTETMISRMQMTGDVTVGSQSRGGHRAEADLAFRCKVCKFTFMSKFAAVQHGIHNHPEYAENIDEIAEPVGIPGAGAKAELGSPDIIEIVSPPRAKIKNMTNFYPNVGDATDRDIAADTEEAPLDLSQSNSNDDDIAERKDNADGRKEPGHKTGLPLPGPVFPPGLPYFLPGQSPFPLLPFYPGLMMPGLFSGDKEAQEKHIKELMTRMQLQAAAGAAPRPPFPGPPALGQGLDIASMMAAQAEAIRKQAELKQQQEAAETLQKLSQMQVLPGAQAGLNKSAVNMSEEGTNSDSGAKVKESETQYKMVMKNGVLMKKQKQRRYRTERPYSCQSCTARFTLRSNMERHIKQQHPETWGDKLKGSRRNFGNMTVPHISPELKEHLHDMAEAEADAEKEENEGEEEGELIIDDAPEDMEDDKPQPDLASISNLLNAANNQSFNQYFNGSQDEDSNTAREMAESNSDTEARDGERKSAYSAAPHKMSCPYCARKFPWESSLKRHILTHTGQKPFKCRECPLWFTTKSNCDRHQVRKHGDTVMGASKHLNMELRDAENTENEDIDDDAEDNVGVVSSYFKCHLCDEDFITRDHVIAHIEHEHQDAYNEDKDVYEAASKMASEIKKPSESCKEDEICRRVNCIFCPCQFVSTNELRKHVLAHVNNKPFACDICNKKFTIKQALMRHKKKHDSGVSSDEENSEEDLPHYRLGLPPAIRPLEPEDNSEAAKMSPSPMSPAPETTVTKRANLMDTINKLSAARAESSKSKRSTLDQIFGVPPPVAGFVAGSSM